jgi:hypothetical protein
MSANLANVDTTFDANETSIDDGLEPSNPMTYQCHANGTLHVPIQVKCCNAHHCNN